MFYLLLTIFGSAVIAMHAADRLGANLFGYVAVIGVIEGDRK